MKWDRHAHYLASGDWTIARYGSAQPYRYQLNRRHEVWPMPQWELIGVYDSVQAAKRALSELWGDAQTDDGAERAHVGNVA